MRTWGIVVAAGSGSRLGAAEPKAFVAVGGMPMIGHSLRAFRGSRFVEGLVVVTPAGYEEIVPPLAEQVAPGLRVMAVAGGPTRSDSVREGMRVADLAGELPEAFVVHDAARPLASAGDIDLVLSALAEADAAVCGAPVADTLRRVEEGATSTVDRTGLYRSFTPQAFRGDTLRAAHAGAPDASDDAALVEAAGGKVVMVESSWPSLKVTTPGDLAFAATVLGPTRTGIGTDFHPFEPGRPLVLGGIEIEAPAGLAGHSDADVLAHACVDAILGAAALGDIGQHFPSGDERWEGAASLGFVREAAWMARGAGWRVGSLDATLILQAPQIARYRDAMRAALAGAVGAPVEAVSVKATTTDGLGFVGRGEGAGALAVATLYTLAR